MVEKAENRLYVGRASRYYGVERRTAGTEDTRKRLIIAKDGESAGTKFKEYLSHIIGGEWQVYEIRELTKESALPLGTRQNILEEALGEAIE